jgi:hypothetical protein
MQKNNKGFMITEVLIVSTIVFSILIFMYAQFRSVYNSFYQTLKYNPVESIYKTNEIKSFIESDAKNNIVDLLSNSQNKYLDITECNIQTYNDVKMCKLLYEKLEIKQLLLLSEDVTSAVASNLSQLDDGMIKFIKYINNNYSGSYHRIVVAFKDGTYATLRIDVLNKMYEFDYTGDVQTFVAPIDAYYQVELWGAQGGSYSETIQGGKGAYTKGTIYLKQNTTLYVYVGGMGKSDTSSKQNAGGYNGGGLSGYHQNAYSFGGGGATDIRLKNGESDNFDSLKSRIMVAAGGGGTAYANSYTHVPGYGGTLIGGTGSGSHNTYTATGGTQTSGGEGYNQVDTRKGNFGFAAISAVEAGGWGGGGGSGYYGGALGFGQGGGGGSSFISGYDGCDAISSESTNDNIVHTGQSVHYSGYKFEYSQMVAGNEEMPSHQTGTMIGNSGNGYAKISIVSE